jgi:glycine cleavage system aminomethyltransferase T
MRASAAARARCARWSWRRGLPAVVRGRGGARRRAHGRAARSCAYGFTVRRNLAYAYLPADVAEGAVVEVEVLGEPVAAEVAADVLYDPEHLRVRG